MQELLRCPASASLGDKLLRWSSMFLINLIKHFKMIFIYIYIYIYILSVLGDITLCASDTRQIAGSETDTP